jgi:hypothetical protein
MKWSQTKKADTAKPQAGFPRRLFSSLTSEAIKKADVVKPIGFHRVGLLFNSPTDQNRLAIYLVVRKPQIDVPASSVFTSDNHHGVANQ